MTTINQSIHPFMLKLTIRKQNGTVEENHFKQRNFFFYYKTEAQGQLKKGRNYKIGQPIRFGTAIVR